ncbi:MAG: hypothetical protein FWF38_08235, partial [Spirochaetaceae bacterium]|nr:hypothetical protein [Spirochaetaceae bacterium]
MKTHKILRFLRTGFLSIILFFILAISVNAEIFIECEEKTFPGGLIRVFAVANEKIENLYVLLNTEIGEKIARFEGFKYNPKQIIGFTNLNIE